MRPLPAVCKHGHSGEMTRNKSGYAHCRRCSREATARYKTRNRARLAEESKARYWADPEPARKKARESMTRRRRARGVLPRDYSCRRGHVWSEMSTLRNRNGSRECRICRGEAMQRWRSTHQAQIRRTRREHYLRTKERLKEQDQERRAKAAAYDAFVAMGEGLNGTDD